MEKIIIAAIIRVAFVGVVKNRYTSVIQNVDDKK